MNLIGRKYLLDCVDACAGGGGLSLEGTVAGTGFLDQARLVEAHPGPTAQSLA